MSNALTNNTKEFGPNIQHIAGVDNISSNKLSILYYTKNYRDASGTIRYLSRINEVFATR